MTFFKHHKNEDEPDIQEIIRQFMAHIRRLKTMTRPSPLSGEAS
jgi:hypothetical protein